MMSAWCVAMVCRQHGNIKGQMTGQDGKFKARNGANQRHDVRLAGGHGLRAG